MAMHIGFLQILYFPETWFIFSETYLRISKEVYVIESDDLI